MDHGANNCVKKQSHTETTAKTEVEEAAPSSAYVDIKIDVNHLKQESGLIQFVKPQPASVVKEEILEDGSEDGNEQQCDQGISTPAGTGSVNEACSTSLGDLLNVKHETKDIDIRPTMLQHKDTHYAINKNTSVVNEQNTTVDDFNKAMPSNDVKKESVEDNLKGCHKQQEVDRRNSGVFHALQSLESKIHKDRLESVCSVQLRRLQTSQYELYSSRDLYTCECCLKKFHSKGGLVSHLQNMPGSKSYRCKICKMNFENQLYLSRHIKQVHDSDEQNHWRFRCDKCLKVCNSASSLYHHRSRVHAKEPHYCTRCNKQFKCKEYLWRHIQYAHSEERYECDLCKKQYKSKIGLQNHVSSFHRNRFTDLKDSKYHCNKCMKTFQSKMALKRHCEDTHGTEQHKCTECNKEYRCIRYLRVHINNVHSQQQFECDICNKIFKSRRMIQRHILRLHRRKLPDQRARNYTCDHCQKSFRKRPSLRQHIEGVHGERVHRCWKCYKTFKSKNRLAAHKSIVHGKLQHECEVCHELFKARCKLRIHAKKAHGLNNIQSKSDMRSQEEHDPHLIASDRAVVGTDTQQHVVVDVKSEPAHAELELGPVVFQHMDSNYRPYNEEPQLD